jgi:hypothetical protein
MGVRSERSGSVVETTASNVPKTGTQVITMTRTKVRSLSLRETLRSFVVLARTATGLTLREENECPKEFPMDGLFSEISDLIQL